MRSAGRYGRGAGRPIPQEDLAKLGPDHLAQEIAERVAKAPATLDPGGDGRRSRRSHSRSKQGLAAGGARSRPARSSCSRSRAKPDGPCRDINFDPTILPNGIHVSDDPFPAARSAAYAGSYNLRTAEAKDYPYHSSRTGGAKP